MPEIDAESQALLSWIVTVRDETVRFAVRCDAAIEALRNGGETARYSPSHAAVKRGSMDLSKMLSKVRR